MEGVLAVIWMFGGNFAPRNWALCDGQLLAISQNSALFSLIGTTYGGDGQTTFALPEMRGRVPMHAGTGPGLSPKFLGQRSGQETVTLNTLQIPQHNHQVTVGVSSATGEENTPGGNVVAMQAGGYNEDPNGLMGGVTQQNAGGSQSHDNLQPYSVVNFVICLQGIFPSRN